MSNLPTKLSALPALLTAGDTTAVGKDANDVRMDRHNTIVCSGVLTGWLGAMIATDLSYGSLIGAAGVGVVGLLPCLILFIALIRGTVTRTIPDRLDPSRVEAAIAMLVHATLRGVRPSERIALQRAIDDACAVLTAMCGTDPWIVVARVSAPSMSPHLASRGDQLASMAPSLIECVMKPHGGDVQIFDKALRPVVTLMAAIIRDFGLDPRGLAANERLLPGMVAGIERPVPAIAENVRRLADEWSSTVRLPETLSTIRANAAVRELDALESAWEAARAVTTAEDQDAVDADFRKACDLLSSTISYSLSAHAATLRDDLTVQTCFIETKHGDEIGDLVP